MIESAGRSSPNPLNTKAKSQRDDLRECSLTWAATVSEKCNDNRPAIVAWDRRGVEGAVLPTSGLANVSTGVGDSQDDSSCCSVIFPVGR